MAKANETIADLVHKLACTDWGTGHLQKYVTEEFEVAPFHAIRQFRANRKKQGALRQSQCRTSCGTNLNNILNSSLIFPSSPCNGANVNPGLTL